MFAATVMALEPLAQPFKQPGPAPLTAFRLARGFAFDVGRFAFMNGLAGRLAFVDWPAAFMDGFANRFAFMNRAAFMDRFADRLAFMDWPATFVDGFADRFAFMNGAAFMDRLAFMNRFTFRFAAVVMEPAANPVTETFMVTTGITPAVTR
jgi:hypothetical protein